VKEEITHMRKSSLVTTLAIAGIATASTCLAADSGVLDLAALQANDPHKSIQFLYAACTAADPQRQMFCLGFIGAMSEHMWLLGGDHSTTRGLAICANSPVSYGAAVQTFKNWAEKHTEAWSLDMMYGVILALQETWPCK
jgi:hypothetical protein